MVNAGIYEGIHFRFADTEARRQGTRVANWIFTNFLFKHHYLTLLAT